MENVLEIILGVADVLHSVFISVINNLNIFKHRLPKTPVNSPHLFA